jgi:hypothetical protein
MEIAAEVVRREYEKRSLLYPTLRHIDLAHCLIDVSEPPEKQFP